MTSTLSSCRRATYAAVISVAAAVTGIGWAGPAAAAPSTSDAQFIKANEQSNLAEISIGQLAQTKGSNARIKELADTTVNDHTQAKTKLSEVAQMMDVSLPSQPNATQLSQAAKLKAASPASFDLLYAQVQVGAHQQALTLARRAQNSTQNADVKAYTTFYIGVASMHLTMAQQALTALGGSPAGVPAGSGGTAATTAAPDSAGWSLALGAGLLLFAGGVVAFIYRRRATTVTR